MKHSFLAVLFFIILGYVSAFSEVSTTQYVPGFAYNAGDLVVSHGVEYKCKESQASAWCSLAVYGPGISSLWSNAWDTTGGEAKIAPLENVASWDANKKYVANDPVVYNDKAYICRGFPQSAWCSQREPGTNGWEEAWIEYTASYTVAPAQEDNAPKPTSSGADKGTDVNENEAGKTEEHTVALRKPTIYIDETDDKYTILINSEFDNENNEADGYIIYRDEQEYISNSWVDGDLRSASVSGIKDNSEHTFYVKTYHTPPASPGRVFSENSDNIGISAIKIAIVEEKDKIQSLLLVSQTSFENIEIGAISDTISISGGDGSGEIVYIITDPTVVTILDRGENKFALEATGVGEATMEIYKAKDDTYLKSNIVVMNIKIINPQIEIVKPGLPTINNFNNSVKFGDIFTFGWVLKTGNKASVAKLYKDNVFIEEQLLSTQNLEESTLQEGTFSFAINDATKDVIHTFYVELCNEDKCIKSKEEYVQFLSEIAQGTTVTGTVIPQEDRLFTSDHFAVGYLPSSKINYFDIEEYATSNMVDIDPLFTHVIIGFAKPNATFDGESFSNTGLEFSMPVATIKRGVEALHAKSVKVFLAVGGYEYQNWEGLANGNLIYKQALVDLVNALDLDGVNINYEKAGVFETNLNEYYRSIIALRSVAKDTNTKLTLSAWSTGADCTVEMTDDVSCANKSSYWGAHSSLSDRYAGRERLVFNLIKQDKYNISQLFDYVFVKSYSGGLTRFDPTSLYDNYREIYDGKLAIGFEIPQENSGEAELASTNSQASSCESTSMLSGNSYGTYDSKKEYSIQRMIGHIREDGANAGIMLWSMYKDRGTVSCANAVTYDGFNVAAKEYLNGEFVSQAQKFESDIGTVYDEINSFIDTEEFKEFIAQSASLEGFTLDISAISNDILAAKTKYENDAKNEDLLNSLSSILKNIKELYKAQKDLYSVQILKNKEKQKKIKKAEEKQKTYKIKLDASYQNIADAVKLFEKNTQVIFNSQIMSVDSLDEKISRTLNLRESKEATYWSSSKASAKTYVSDDLIYFDGQVYSCVQGSASAWCNSRAPGTNGWESAWITYNGEYTLDSAIDDNKAPKSSTPSKKVVLTQEQREAIQLEIDKQKIIIGDFSDSFKTETSSFTLLLDVISTQYSKENDLAVTKINNDFNSFKLSSSTKFAQLVAEATKAINALRAENDKQLSPTIETGASDSKESEEKEVYENDALDLFDAKIERIDWALVFSLTYKDTSDVDFRDAQIVISAPFQLEHPDFSIIGSQLSSTNPEETYESVDSKIYTTITFNGYAKEYVTTILKEKGAKLVFTLYPPKVKELNLDDFKFIKLIPGKKVLSEEPEGERRPNRNTDPISLQVKGWPNTLAMGTVTDNNIFFNENIDFAQSRVDAIFKYAGNGFGDIGKVIDPNIVSLQTVRQARYIETLAKTDLGLSTKVMPTLVVYTANASGAALAELDIKVNHRRIASNDTKNNTDLKESNVVKHFRNTIRLAAQLQMQKDAQHPYPASIVLDADLFGEWQKEKLSGRFQAAYCGGSGDRECESYLEVKVREAMIIAIDLEKDFVLSKIDASQITKTGVMIPSGTLSQAYDLDAIKAKITEDSIPNNVKGWVQSQNFMFKVFSPDVSFGWVINLWNPGSAHWVHKKYSGDKEVWEKASKGVALFVKWIGAYEDNEYRPDFLVFDKYERDGFGKGGTRDYAFSSRAWDNYLTYVKQITDFINIPAMLWQIPGGHMVAKNEKLEGDLRLCGHSSIESENSKCFRHLDEFSEGSDVITADGHSASGGSYFMSDALIGKDISNIREDVLNIKLSGIHYNDTVINKEGKSEAVEIHNVRDLLNVDPTHDWGESELRHAVFSNAFAILWGGGGTTGTVAISTNRAGGHGWLKKKVANYKANEKIVLYSKNSIRDSKDNSNKYNDLSVISGLPQFDETLKAVTDKMNNEVFLFHISKSKTEPSTVYKWADFLKALKSIHNEGIAGEKFWLYDNKDDEKAKSYAQVAIASFLSQTMHESIQYNACDENSWQRKNDAGSSEAVKESLDRGDFTQDLPMDAACGQLGQVYSDYGVDVYGVDNPYSCPRAPEMEVTAVTNAYSYWGAPGPLFAAPDRTLESLGLLKRDSSGTLSKPGRWKEGGDCLKKEATKEDFVNPTNEAWLRKECKIYKHQIAGRYIWDGSSKRSLEGCVWWGRGAIQTTGRENFGKLNHFLARSHIKKSLIGKKVAWADTQIEVLPAPKEPLYPDIDICSNPEIICSSKAHKELKWVAGLFFWVKEVQGYNKADGKYKDWNYKTELKKYVDSGFGKSGYKPLNGISFLDATSGIVNRGCPDLFCTGPGLVSAARERKENFKKVLLDGFGVSAN